MQSPFSATPILVLLLACGGGNSSESEAQPEPVTDTTAGDETSSENEVAQTEPEGDTEPEEGRDEPQPVDHQHANIRLLDSVANGNTPFSELVDVDEKGLLVVENHDGPNGRLIQNASHFCHHALERRYEHLTERLREDLERGRELNDMACNAVLTGPPRTDCSMGGTEEIPTTHYIFEETDDGLRLEAIYRVSEIGKNERYVSHAFRFVDRQTAQTRRHGCR